MKSLTNKQPLPQEHFYKICVVGGGMTGAIMALLLKKSKLFNTNDIAWIMPNIKIPNDLRTTFYNEESIELLSKLNIWSDLKKSDYTHVKKIQVFGKKNATPLIWDNSNKDKNFGAIVKNKVMLDSIFSKLNDIKKYENFVTNTTCDNFERTLYLNDKHYVKTNLVLCADGKNSQLRKLLLIKTILKKSDYTNVKKIQVFGKKNTTPLIWNNFNKEQNFGAVVKNKVMLDSIFSKLDDIKKFENFVTNTTCDNFERTLYFNDKHYIKTNLVLCADGKNSQLRKLLLIKTILKKTGHIAISGFLEQSKDHKLTATQAFTELGPIGLLPFENKNKINFVLSVEETKYKNILSKHNPELYICDKLENFFSNLNLNFKPIKKINNLNNNLSSWPLDLNFIINPTANRAVLIGDAAHSIHPLAGQGLNLAMRDCVSVMNSIEESSKFGNDLGDISILNSYKKDRLSKTIAMTAITDFLFYGFASNSNIAQTILSKGMETLNKSKLKNIFSKLAAK